MRGHYISSGMYSQKRIMLFFHSKKFVYDVCIIWIKAKVDMNRRTVLFPCEFQLCVEGYKHQMLIKKTQASWKCQMEELGFFKGALV